MPSKQNQTTFIDLTEAPTASQPAEIAERLSARSPRSKNSIDHEKLRVEQQRDRVLAAQRTTERIELIRQRRKAKTDNASLRLADRMYQAEQRRTTQLTDTREIAQRFTARVDAAAERRDFHQQRLEAKLTARSQWVSERRNDVLQDRVRRASRFTRRLPE